MSEFGAYIKKIRESKHLTLNQVALYSEISAAQLSRIETGKRGVPKPQTIKKISEALKVDYDELMIVAGYIKKEQNENNFPDLTDKEEEDIMNDLEKIMNKLENKNGLANFGGHTLDELDEEDKELLLSSLQNSMRVAKKIAKQKYTPKKYRK